MSDRLIVFDCDGVLVDSEPLACEGYRRVFARRALDLPAAAFYACIGLKQADILAAIAASTGLVLPGGAEAEIWPEIEALLAERLAPTVGVAAFLAGLDGPRCVASSSTPERIRRSLEKTGLAGFFGDALFSTAQVARGKPAPDVFFAAAAAFAVPPAACAVVEDSPAGILAARAAGMVPIGFVGAGHGGSEHAARLAAAGAETVCGAWPEVAAALAAAGFSAAEDVVPPGAGPHTSGKPSDMNIGIDKKIKVH